MKALKALVKLQALVRGHIVRKQTADMLKRMQTLVKLQSQARANRGQSNSKPSFAHIVSPLVLLLLLFISLCVDLQLIM